MHGKLGQSGSFTLSKLDFPFQPLLFRIHWSTQTTTSFRDCDAKSKRM